MNPASDRATAVFFKLSTVPVEDRARVLDERCAGDATLREEVERLLEGLEAPDAPFASPVAGSEASHDALLAGGTVIGDFVVVRRLGAGATGVVYLAHQRHPSRVVALKVLRQEFLASAVRRRFETEAELLGQLQHPGIAHVYAAHPGDEATPPYIAMELVNGPPLTEFADGHELTARQRVALVAQVCDAVQHAHQRGVIHRDLKPGNILVGEDGRPKILDFGVARRVGGDAAPLTMATEAGQLVGTLAYMSPEQVQAKPEAIDTRTDIYALGVILFRLLAGRLPFGHDNPSLPELARRIAQDEPPRLGAIDPALRGDLEIVVSRALAKERERRYPGAAGLGADLRSWLEGQPISATADSAWYLVRRQVRRYRLALALSGLAVVGLAGLASYAIVQRTRADRTSDQLTRELAASTIERGRLTSLNGNHPVAESLVWSELFLNPDSRHAKWALWEIYAREPTLWTKIEHEDGTQTVRFSPDGRLLAASGRVNGVVHLVDPATGRVVRELVGQPRSGVQRAKFTPDGRTLVVGSVDGTLRAWDVATGVLVREIPKAVDRLYDFAIASDSVSVITVAWGHAQVWSIVTGTRLPDLPPAEIVSTDAASPVGPIVVLGHDDGGLTGVDVVRRTRLWEVPHAHPSLVSSVAMSSDGRLVASGSTEGTINIWNAETGEHLRRLTTENGRVRSLSFDSIGTKLAAAGEWRTLVWDLTRAGDAPTDVGGAEGVTDMHLQPHGTALATCHGSNGMLRLWELGADPREIHWATEANGITGFARTSADALVVSGRDGRLAQWRTGDLAPRMLLKSAAAVLAFATSQDGRFIATVGATGTSAVWDAADGHRIATLEGLKSSRAVAFADDDRRIVAGEGNALVLFDWTGTEATFVRRTDSLGGETLTMLGRGREIFVASRNQLVTERDAVSGDEIRRFKPSAAPFALALSGDGRRLAAGTYIGDVDLWDLEAGRPVGGFKGQTAVLSGLAFSDDSSLLAMASRDGSTTLFDVVNGRGLATVSTRARGANRVQFLHQDRRLAIGYDDGEVEILDLDYYFRFAAGQAEYQLSRMQKAGDVFPRAGEVIAWSQRVLAGR